MKTIPLETLEEVIIHIYIFLIANQQQNYSNVIIITFFYIYFLLPNQQQEDNPDRDIRGCPGELSTCLAQRTVHKTRGNSSSGASA